MAVTQYIGARYVPKIYDNPDDNTNNWKQGIEYEPLTMVSYAGGSYTSKVPVPASAANPADAPQYWAYMGSSSGQITTNTNNISRIQHAIANATEAGNVCTTARAVGDYVWIDGTLYRCTAAIAVNDSYIEGINISPVTDMATALNAIQAISTDVTGLQSDVLTLEGSITTLDGKITNLETELSDPYTLCIGDSYAEGYDPAGNNRGWPAYLFDLGVRGEAIAAGGSGFSLATSDTRSPMYLIQHASLQVADSEVGRIIICEGYNDLGANANALSIALTDFINYCKSRFVNAKIYVGMCGYAWTHNENNRYGAQLTDTAKAYYGAVNLTSAIFMPQVVGVLLGCNGMSTADYKHPNELGNRNIAAAIWAALHGVSYSTSSYYSIALTNSSIDASATLGIQVTVTDGNVFTYQRCSPTLSFNSSTAHGLANIPLDAPHMPCFPYMLMLIAKVMHNYDMNSGLGKLYYNHDFYIKVGYESDQNAHVISKMVNDAGNNFATSNHVDFNDTEYYNASGSFL